jgi:hypothetical protein
MDKRVSDALAFANYRLTLQIQRQNIDARIAAALLVSYQGAIFKATHELIAFVESKLRIGGELLVEDQSGNVILIELADAFLSTLVVAYDSAMKFKQQELQRLKSARTTAKIVGL